MVQRGKSIAKEGGNQKEIRRTFKMLREVWLNIRMEKIDMHKGIVMLDSHLGNKSNIFHHNNKNNQLERRVWPTKETIRCLVVDLSILLE